MKCGRGQREHQRGRKCVFSKHDSLHLPQRDGTPQGSPRVLPPWAPAQTTVLFLNSSSTFPRLDEIVGATCHWPLVARAIEGHLFKAIIFPELQRFLQLLHPDSGPRPIARRDSSGTERGNSVLSSEANQHILIWNQGASAKLTLWCLESSSE